VRDMVLKADTATACRFCRATLSETSRCCVSCLKVCCDSCAGVPAERICHLVHCGTRSADFVMDVLLLSE